MYVIQKKKKKRHIKAVADIVITSCKLCRMFLEKKVLKQFNGLVFFQPNGKRKYILIPNCIVVTGNPCVCNQGAKCQHTAFYSDVNSEVLFRY